MKGALIRYFQEGTGNEARKQHLWLELMKHLACFLGLSWPCVAGAAALFSGASFVSAPVSSNLRAGTPVPDAVFAGILT